MNWERSGEVGHVSEPYRIGKFVLDKVIRYGLHCGYECLGYFQTWEEAQEAAERHAQREVMEGRT